MNFKVQLFWESHKDLRTLPHGFGICLVNVKTMRKIVQIFVAFSEKLNFKALTEIKEATKNRRSLKKIKEGWNK